MCWWNKECNCHHEKQSQVTTIDKSRDVSHPFVNKPFETPAADISETFRKYYDHRFLSKQFHLSLTGAVVNQVLLSDTNLDFPARTLVVDNPSGSTIKVISGDRTLYIPATSFNLVIRLPQPITVFTAILYKVGSVDDCTLTFTEEPLPATIGGSGGSSGGGGGLTGLTGSGGTTISGSSPVLNVNSPAIDTTVGDIQNVGPAAAVGATGEVADAGHQHAGVGAAVAGTGISVSASTGSVTITVVPDTVVADIAPVAATAAAGATAKPADAGHQHVGVHTVVAGAGISVSGASGDVTISATGGGSLTSNSIDLTADVTITTANTYQTILQFTGLAAGTYAIEATVTALMSSAGSRTEIAIEAPSGTRVASGMIDEQITTQGNSLTIHKWNVTLAANATINLIATSSSNTTVIKAALTENGVGNNATVFSYIKTG